MPRGRGPPQTAARKEKRRFRDGRGSTPSKKTLGRGKGLRGRAGDADAKWGCFACGAFTFNHLRACCFCRQPRPTEGPTADWRTAIPECDPDGVPRTLKERAQLFKKDVESRRTITVHDCPETFNLLDLEQHWAEIGGRKAFSARWIEVNENRHAFFLVRFRTPELAARAAAIGAPSFAGRRLRLRTHSDRREGGAALLRRAWDLLPDVDLRVLNEGKKVKLRPVHWSPLDLRSRPIAKAFPQALRYADHDGDPIGVYEAFYKEHTLSVLPYPVEPVLTWDEVNFGTEVTASLRAFAAPTPIQSLAWPVLLAGRDCIGLAKTGSGKTLAFLLPAVIHLRAQSATLPKEGPIVLILAPVRELVVQIANEAARFKNAGFTIGEVSGGYGFTGRLGQAEVVLGGVDMLVATPKRLATFVECGIVPLSRVSFLVLDEADRMLDMGFEIQIQELVSQLRPDRQTSMFTATWGPDVHNMAQQYLRYDVAQIVACGGTEESEMANPDVEQRFIFNTTDFDRTKEVVKLVRQLKLSLQAEESSRLLLFCSRTTVVDEVAAALSVEWKKVYSLHSGLLQREREANLRQFMDDPHAILVATDLAGRGLDIKGLPCVINVQMPLDMLQYIHRIGRTGRAGKKGVAYSFLEAHHRHLAPDLIKILKNVGQPIPLGLLDLRDRPHLFYSSEVDSLPLFSHGLL